MLALRRFSIQNVFNQVKAGKKIGTLDVQKLALEVQAMKQDDLNKFCFILTGWYKARNGHEELLTGFEKDITEKLNTLDFKNFSAVLKNFVFLYKNHYNRLGANLLKGFLDRFSSISNQNEKILAGASLSKLALLYKRQGLGLSESFASILTSSVISEAALPEFFGLLQIINNFFQCELIDPFDCEELFEACEVKIEKELSNMDHLQRFECLIHLIVSRSKSEDLLRKIEKLVFNQLSLIKIGELPKLIKYYQKRNLHDYHYLMNKVYKPMYEDFIARIEELRPKLFTSYLTTWKQVGSFQGLYCETQILDKFKSLINKYKAADSDATTNDAAMLSILSLSNFTGFKGNSEIAEIIVKHFEKRVNTLYEPQLVSLAYEISLHPGLSPAFWHSFNTQFSKVFAAIEKKGYLYGIFLNLSLQDPNTYSIVEKNFSTHIDTLQKSWLGFREADLTKSIKGKFHQLVETEMKNLKIDFVSEHYDNYFIDIAVPKEKIAFEVLGPGHYVFPSGSLNGKTQNKKRNLQKLGWKYIDLPFHLNKIGFQSLNKTIKDSLPLVEVP